MSIIYGKNDRNETIIFSIVGEVNPSNQTRPDRNYNYEVLLPVIFVIVFILVLFLVYAYNNLNLKQFLSDYICCLGRRRRRRRRWRYAQYDPQYHASYGPTYVTQVNTQFQKPNQSSLIGAPPKTVASFKMSTFGGIGGDRSHHRRQNVYYTYRGTGRPIVAAGNHFNETHFYSRGHSMANNYAVINNYDQVLFSGGPNYAYRLNHPNESGSTTSASDYRLPGSSQIGRIYPLHSRQLALEYSDSNGEISEEFSSNQRSSVISGNYSPVVFKINNSTTENPNRSLTPSSSSPSLRTQSNKRRSINSGVRNSNQLKQRSSTFKTLNATPETHEDHHADEMIFTSWNRHSIKSRRLSKLSSRLKNLSSDGSLLKTLYREIKLAASSDYNNRHSNDSFASVNKQFGYSRLCKSFSFVTAQSRKKPLIDEPNIEKQQERLNINHDVYFSEPSQLNFTPSVDNRCFKHDAWVQTSTTIFSDGGSTSANNETTMQTNTFGSILANLGSASIRPSSVGGVNEGLFEINRALKRHRAFSDGNGLSTLPPPHPQPIHHSVSSSKLFYKRL